MNDFPNPRRGFHFGGSVGVLAASNLDTFYGTISTGWGAAVSGHVGYEISFSKRWSVGVLAGLAVYRYWESEAGVSSTSDGLLPTLALSFSFGRPTAYTAYIGAVIQLRVATYGLDSAGARA